MTNIEHCIAKVFVQIFHLTMIKIQNSLDLIKMKIDTLIHSDLVNIPKQSSETPPPSTSTRK